MEWYEIQYRVELENEETKEIYIDSFDICEYFLEGSNDFDKIEESEVLADIMRKLIVSMYKSSLDLQECFEYDEDFQDFIRNKYKDEISSLDEE